MNIIFVDDEREELQRFQEMIGDLSQITELMCFPCGAEAIEYARRHFIDLAFLDIHMPEMDGFSLTERLQNIQPDIHIFFLTADPTCALQAFRANADGYILKPYDRSTLRQEIEKARKKYHISSRRSVYFQTMPRFELFVDGQLIPITKRKVKELLALLVDLKGSTLSSGEAIACLWEDRPEDSSTKALFRMTAKRLRDFLIQEELDFILIEENGVRAIDIGKVFCDYYALLAGDMEALRAYQGEYMVQYSWAEMTNARLDELVQTMYNRKSFGA